MGRRIIDWETMLETYLGTSIKGKLSKLYEKMPMYKIAAILGVGTGTVAAKLEGVKKDYRQSGKFVENYKAELDLFLEEIRIAEGIGITGKAYQKFLHTKKGQSLLLKYYRIEGGE